MPLLSLCIAVLVILIASVAIKFIFSHGTQIPIALSDQITSRKKRVDRYRFDSRNVLTEAYSKVLVQLSAFCHVLIILQFKSQIFGINTSEGPIIHINNEDYTTHIIS